MRLRSKSGYVAENIENRLRSKEISLPQTQFQKDISKDDLILYKTLMVMKIKSMYELKESLICVKNRVDFLRKVNRWMLLGVVIGVAVLMVYGRYLYHSEYNLRLLMLEDYTGSAKVMTVEKEIVSENRGNVFLEAYERKNIFKAHQIKSIQLDSEELNEKVKMFQQNYILLGIVVDRPPIAIIEDKSSKTSLFLSEGDRLGVAIILSIEQNQVVYQIDEKILELKQ